MPFNVRGVVGKRKGKFVKQKMKDKVERLLRSTAGKQGRRSCSQSEVSLVFINIGAFIFH